MEKADFRNYRALLLEVQQLKVQLAVLESSLYSPKGQQFSKTPRSGSGPKSTMDDAVAGHIKLRELLESKLAEQEAQQLKIENAIFSLSDVGERVVMRELYLRGQRWPAVIREMQKRGYSERTAYRLHGHALLKLKEV
jgi:hypothetical protein